MTDLENTLNCTRNIPQVLPLRTDRALKEASIASLADGEVAARAEHHCARRRHAHDANTLLRSACLLCVRGVATETESPPAVVHNIQITVDECKINK